MLANKELLKELLKLLNEWWQNETVPIELTQANIASIYKKGNTERQEHYRPISLLNIFYKIIASILKQRIEQGIDTELQSTQYGFRKNKSTSQALHCIRRIQENTERGHTKINLILLDWEKAFDKIYNEKLFEAMERMGYQNPQFRVKICEHMSDWKNQETGIRQGCPLSPYLFLIVMTVLFKDLHADDHLGTIRHRQANCNMDEVLYADDTILISPDTRTINKYLAELEQAAILYRLIYFEDGTKVKKVEEALYLGVTLNKTLDINTEVRKIIKQTMETWKNYEICGNIAMLAIRRNSLHSMRSLDQNYYMD